MMWRCGLPERKKGINAAAWIVYMPSQTTTKQKQLITGKEEKIRCLFSEQS